jgi:regulator of replication initiation timing
MKNKISLYHNLTKRIYNQRKEINQLRKSASNKNNAILRLENQQYRKALSNIAFRSLNEDQISNKVLLRITENALNLYGLKKFDRKKIENFHKNNPNIRLRH